MPSRFTISKSSEKLFFNREGPFLEFFDKTLIFIRNEITLCKKVHSY